MLPSGPGKNRFSKVLIFSGVIYVIMMVGLSSIWYAPQWISSFHFFNDLPEWKQMDKVAHFFWTFQVSAVASRLMHWAMPDDKLSARTGAIMGFLFVSGIEVADGFSIAYGASIFDIMANALGAIFFLGQRMLWKKILVWPKFSFHPTAFAPMRPEVLGNGLFEEIVKDYNGQTFWYSFHLPWIPLPRWLTVAVGIGADGMIYGRDHENAAVHFTPDRKYYVSLDLDLSHVQSSSKFVKALCYIPNIIKVPAPAIEISSEGVRFHPLYF